MVKDSIKFSIVCPVYNSQDFLGECIESVFNQKYQNWELILVNDGSTDGSAQICEEYAKREKRINLINQNNSGQFLARFVGIKAISGDYVLFLDSDDKLSENALETLFLTLSNNRTDIVWFSYSFEKAQIVNPFYLTNDDNIKNGDSLNELFAKRIGFFLWDKCFSRELFYNMQTKMDFKFNNFSEDTLMVYLISSNSNSIQIINKKLYYYRYNEKSKVHMISRTDQIGRDYIYTFIYSQVSKKYAINSSVYALYLQKYLDLVFKVIIFSKYKQYKKDIRYIFRNYRSLFEFKPGNYINSKKQLVVFSLYNKKMFLAARFFGLIMFHSSFKKM